MAKEIRFVEDGFDGINQHAKLMWNGKDDGVPMPTCIGLPKTYRGSAAVPGSIDPNGGTETLRYVPRLGAVPGLGFIPALKRRRTWSEIKGGLILTAMTVGGVLCVALTLAVATR